MISVVDAGTGNLGSVMNMLKHVGAPAQRVTLPEEILAASALLLPGVGHFGHAMGALAQRELIGPLRTKVLTERVPILGICLGMQLLGSFSEEGNVEGLGFIPARFEKMTFAAESSLKVPHMGWNKIAVKKDGAILSRDQEARFYFVHSYRAVCENEADVLATCNYGQEFCCAYSRDNIYGVQFHPEKSHRFGMDLFRRFVEWTC